MRADRLVLGGVLLGATAGMAVLAGTMWPHDPIRQDLSFSLFSPSRFHPLGTDRLGRDVLARVAHGAGVSLRVGTLAALLAGLAGTAAGLAAGASGGRLDRVLMRAVDVLLAFPTLVLLVVLAGLFRTDNEFALILLLGGTTWMGVARLVRAEALVVSRRGFVEAAAGLGAPAWRRALRHLAPNVASTAIVAATLQVGDLMLMESGLSYLGLGVAAPTPTWGDMVRQGMTNLGDAWWIATFPGLALALAVTGFNLTGDGLRDLLQPRLSGAAPAPRRRRPAAASS